MNVTLFPVLKEESHSMHVYCRELAGHLSKKISSRVFQPNDVPLPSFLNKPLNKWLLYIMQAKSAQRDLNHIVDHGYSHLLLSLDKKRTVVTCHDLHPLELPETVTWHTRKLFKKKMELMLQAGQIIATSQHTKQDIMKHFPEADESKITVVYNGVAEAFKRIPREEIAALKERFGISGKKVVLNISIPEPYKNISFLFNAFALLKDKDAVLVKVAGLLRSEQALLKKLGLGRRVVLVPFIPEKEVVKWYSATDIFVFPSLHEGFGFPVLEAMRCGCPVICSEAASLPEVAGKAALFVEPEDTNALASAIETVLASNALRKKMSQKGLEQARKFSWEKTARETEAVYTEVCE